jgi:hypothetical protein
MADRALRLRRRMLFTAGESERWHWLNTAGQWVTCRVAGHEPERDQCGRPEHDFCLWCNKSMPHAADAIVARRRLIRKMRDEET